MQYRISVHGCDDSTTVRMDLDEEELRLLTTLEALINATRNYGCMPSMQIQEAENQ